MKKNWLYLLFGMLSPFFLFSEEPDNADHLELIFDKNTNLRMEKDSFIYESSALEALTPKQPGYTILPISSKRLDFPGFPKAYNPALAKTQEGFILLFRFHPDRSKLWITENYLVRLDENLNPISKPQLLSTRNSSSKTPSQSEDLRLFEYQNDFYIIYNDNQEIVNPSNKERRDIFISKLVLQDEIYMLEKPLRLLNMQKYQKVLWEKNWVPFVHEEKLYLAYSLNPHIILDVNLKNGTCNEVYETNMDFPWKWGKLRGGTPASIIDGDYFAFFHSAISTTSTVAKDEKTWHYYMGAYTFSSQPPFELKKVTPSPIIAKGLYTNSGAEKRVIFPGGFTYDGQYLYVCYGKDDREIWIAKINKERLFKDLFDVN